MFAAVFTISCEPLLYCDSCDHVEIINNSEYNITQVIIIDSKKGNAIVSEIGDQIIVKNGGSKSYSGTGSERSNSIVCVKSEDNSKLMCSPEFFFYCETEISITTTFIWNGSNDPAWQPQEVFYEIL
jgi:hypothetical protein